MAGYIGNVPVPQATQTRDNFTATAGQTTFATSGYTPGYLDVYLNGVHLDPSDYTATNGSDVVLDTGASADDVVTVVAFSTFEVADQAFSGDTSVTNAGTALTANRTGSNGTIVDLQKDGTTVGSVSVAGSQSNIISVHSSTTPDSCGLGFYSDNTVRPVSDTGVDRDNAVDLGRGATRFKDLYLSGGVYLGGTGSANHLDDYEEGEWSPSVNVGSVTTSYRRYVKIGRQVTVSAFLHSFTNRSSTTDIRITGLPFTSSSTSRKAGPLMARFINQNSGCIAYTLYVGANSSEIAIYGQFTGAYDPLEFADLNNSSAEMYIQITYETDS